MVDETQRSHPSGRLLRRAQSAPINRGPSQGYRPVFAKLRRGYIAQRARKKSAEHYRSALLAGTNLKPFTRATTSSSAETAAFCDTRHVTVV